MLASSIALRMSTIYPAVTMLLVRAIMALLHQLPASCPGRGLSDSGPGFSPEHIENLPLASKKRDGLGIGLSLCRSIIEAHGGQLHWRHVQREDWSGSHCLSLKTMSDPIHLALIDDDEAVLDALRHYFSRRNVRTFCYHLATDFVAAIDRAEPFDCVVSDIRMPGMSGLELVNRLHELAIAWPIILITGHGDIDMAVAAIKNGVFDFIEKPFDEARLLASIRQAVETKGGVQVKLPKWMIWRPASTRFRIGSAK